jgi:hypothetical protein
MIDSITHTPPAQTSAALISSLFIFISSKSSTKKHAAFTGGVNQNETKKELVELRPSQAAGTIIDSNSKTSPSAEGLQKTIIKEKIP